LKVVLGADGFGEFGKILTTLKAQVWWSERIEPAFHHYERERSLL